MDLKSFKLPIAKLAPRETFQTRQCDVLSYRIYPALSENLVILYHGVGSDSRYLCVLASALAASGKATVVTPDFRCHGASYKLSDNISPSQLEIDLEELIIHIKSKRAVSRIILAGHSLGGGFVLKVATSEIRSQFSNFLALAPYLPPSFQSFREDLGGWVSFENGSMTVLLPKEYQTGFEKLQYSAQYLKAAEPGLDIIEALQALKPPLKILTGAQDEVAAPVKHEQLFLTAGIDFNLLPGLDHLGIVSKPEQVLSHFDMFL